MSEPESSAVKPPAADDAAAVDQVLAEFGGDYRKAISILLRQLDDARSLVSRGFARGVAAAAWRGRRATE